MKNSSTKHNKKRSVGIIYEMLVKTVSSALVADDTTKSSTALNIIKKHFRSDSEIYKEFRIINSLMKVEISSSNVANSIMTEAKNAVKEHDISKLDREKSLLLRDINHKLDGSIFWEQSIPDYKMLATIQVLVNNWRQPGNLPLDKLAVYEQSLQEWLVQPKQTLNEAPSTISSGDNRLLFKIMLKKLNEKYGLNLSAEQKSLLREYVFSNGENGNSDKFRNSLKNTQSKMIEAIEAYLTDPKTNEYVKSQMNEMLSVVREEKLDEVSDEVFTRFMLYTKLISELESEEK